MLNLINNVAGFKTKVNLLVIAILVFTFMFTMFGCSSPTYLKAQEKIVKNIDRTTDLLAPAHVVVTDEPFIDNKPIFHEYRPKWTERKVTIDLGDTTVKFKELMAQIFRSTSRVKVIYQGGIEDVDISGFSVDGSMIDVLKSLAKQANYHFLIEEDDIIWTPKMTKIFQIGVLPGSVNYTMGGPSNNQGVSGFGGRVVGDETKGGDVTYKSAGGQSVWDSLNSTITKLVSKEGSYVINKDASTLTVIDRPNSMDAIEDYVKKFNNYHLQQVGIKVQVIEVELDENHKRGIDWQLLRNNVKNGNFDLDTNLSANVAPLLTNTSGAGASLSYVLDNERSPLDGSNGVIQFLERQGNLTVLSEPRFTVLNNQVAEIKITRDEGYIARIQNTVAPNGQAAITQVGVEPGSIKTGFTLYVVPTIFDQEVLMQITTSISRNVALTSIATQSGDTIQLPTISDRRFTQRSVVPNNATLLLTGFKQLENSTGDTTPFKVSLLGGQGAVNRTTEIVLLITPVIIRG